MKTFTTEGVCYPELNYMVDTSDRISEMKSLVDAGKYIVINRPRQFGKSTSLFLLEEALQKDCLVFSIDFQIGYVEMEKSSSGFLKGFFGLLLDCAMTNEEAPDGLADFLLACYNDKDEHSFVRLPSNVRTLCSLAKKPVVLIIDEVDRATDFSYFISLLSTLRALYLKRLKNITFKSVVLASVIDIKNLKVKIAPDSDVKLSPWNIAVNFNESLSFSIYDVSKMLDEYASDNSLVFDIAEASRRICEFTAGYPFMVSDICLRISSKVAKGADPKHAWSFGGVLSAACDLASSNSTLLESLMDKVKTISGLKQALYSILLHNETVSYNPYITALELGVRYGLLKTDGLGNVIVGNMIMETCIYNYFIDEMLEERRKGIKSSTAIRNVAASQFIEDGFLNMDSVIERFCRFYSEVYSEKSQKYLEKECCIIFLSFLRPIINGTGRYFIEAQTRDEHRTDVVVYYSGRIYVIELKIWKGQAYNAKGEKQLIDYLNHYELDKGYLLTFSFINDKKTGIAERVIGGKTLYEAIV
jgi:hypothetical protein